MTVVEQAGVLVVTPLYGCTLSPPTATFEEVADLLRWIRALAAGALSRMPRDLAGVQYFLPFMTAALACLGRIRALLARMGRDVAGGPRGAVPQIRNLCARRGEVDVDGGGNRGSDGWKMFC